MTNSNKHNSECGPFIACGAAAVSMSHEPGEPTSVDNVVAAIKHLFKHENAGRYEGIEAGRPSATAHQL